MKVFKLQNVPFSLVFRDYYYCSWPTLLLQRLNRWKQVAWGFVIAKLVLCFF